jgi:hypothetical protein
VVGLHTAGQLASSNQQQNFQKSYISSCYHNAHFVFVTPSLTLFPPLFLSLLPQHNMFSGHKSSFDVSALDAEAVRAISIVSENAISILIGPFRWRTRPPPQTTHTRSFLSIDALYFNP